MHDLTTKEKGQILDKLELAGRSVANYWLWNMNMLTQMRKGIRHRNILFNIYTKLYSYLGEKPVWILKVPLWLYHLFQYGLCCCTSQVLSAPMPMLTSLTFCNRNSQIRHIPDVGARISIFNAIAEHCRASSMTFQCHALHLNSSTP